MNKAFKAVAICLSSVFKRRIKVAVINTLAVTINANDLNNKTISRVKTIYGNGKAKSGGSHGWWWGVWEASLPMT